MRYFKNNYPLLKSLSTNIYFVLGIMFLIRISLIFIFGKPFEIVPWFNWIFRSDSEDYIGLATELFYGGPVKYPFRLPGYPFLLLWTHSLFSAQWLGTIIFQQIISVLTAFLIYRFSQKYIKKYALIVPVLFLMEPSGLLISYNLLPETIMIILQVVSIVLLVKGSEEHGMWRAGFVILSSLALCLEIFFKPVLLYFFIVNIIFIIFYFSDSLVKRIIYVIIFIAVFQLPVHFYRQYIGNKFGVYSLTRQEFSEKAGRTIDIKHHEETGRDIELDSIRAEIRRTLIGGGFRYEKPDYKLYAHITDSIAKTNIRKYPIAIAYHSFFNSYYFFAPSRNLFFKLLNESDYRDFPSDVTIPGKILYLLRKMTDFQNLIVFLFSLFFSIILLLPFLFLLFRRELWKKYSPLLYFSFMSFIYTSVLVGRIAQLRYRVTFAWLFIIVAVVIIELIKTKGWRALFPFKKSSKDKINEPELKKMN